MADVNYINNYGAISNSQGPNLLISTTVAFPVNCIVLFSGNTQNIDTISCTWQGQSFTKIGSIAKPANTGHSSVWVLMNPIVGTGNITLAWATNASYRAAVALTFSGVGEIVANTPQTFRGWGAFPFNFGTPNKPGMFVSSIGWYENRQFSSEVGVGNWAGTASSSFARLATYYRSFASGENITVTVNSPDDYSFSLLSLFLYPIKNKKLDLIIF